MLLNADRGMRINSKLPGVAFKAAWVELTQKSGRNTIVFALSVAFEAA